MDLANHREGNSSLERHTVPKNASDTTSEGVLAGLATGERMSWPKELILAALKKFFINWTRDIM